MKKIGLTGSISTGKSAAAGILRSLGFPVVDADQISHDLSLKDASGYKAILAEFGTGILDQNQNLDRKKLRELVFQNPEKKKKLESILHPLILKESQKQLEEIIKSKKTNAVFYEAPLLLEAGRYQEFDGVLLITCPEHLQMERLLKRTPELNPTQAKQIIASQMPQSEKEKKSTWILSNEGTLEDLKQKIQDWAKKHL